MTPEEETKKYRNELNKIVDSDRTIPGIFNYCDRWCERCTLSSRCTTYLMEQFYEDEIAKPSDEENKKFWDQISFNFTVVRDMLEEAMDKFDITEEDLEDIEIEPLNKKEKSKAEKLSFDYAMKMSNWLENNSDYFNSKGNSYSIINDEINIELSDAIEIVQFYEFFIAPKIARANSEKLFRTDDKDFIQSDNNGSAKIALIAINRSIEALGILTKYFPEKEDELLDFLVTLSRIKKLVDNDFPNAMEFIRPGFDEI